MTTYTLLDHNGRKLHAFFSESAVINAAEAWADKCGDCVFWSGTLREYLKNYSGLTPEQEWSEDDHEESGWIANLAAEYGWDTTLCRASGIYGEDWSTTPTTHFEAAIAYLEHDGDTVRVEEEDGD